MAFMYNIDRSDHINNLINIVSHYMIQITANVHLLCTRTCRWYASFQNYYNCLIIIMKDESDKRDQFVQREITDSQR